MEFKLSVAVSGGRSGLRWSDLPVGSQGRSWPGDLLSEHEVGVSPGGTRTGLAHRLGGFIGEAACAVRALNGGWRPGWGWTFRGWALGLRCVSLPPGQWEACPPKTRDSRGLELPIRTHRPPRCAKAPEDLNITLHLVGGDSERPVFSACLPLLRNDVRRLIGPPPTRRVEDLDPLPAWVDQDRSVPSRRARDPLHPPGDSRALCEPRHVPIERIAERLRDIR